MDKIIDNAKTKMKKSINVMLEDFGTIRAGRANPAVLDRVKIDYYGSPTPINQVAAVSVAEARILVISPWDKSTLGMIEKAIQASDVGINPQNDGQVLRLIFPQLTEDRRKELVKEIKKMGEECKVAIRSIRRDAMEKCKALKKNNEITEDDLKGAEETIQKITDKNVKEVDEQVAVKEKEILSI
ncbi:ribosome-recycling factor [Ruminococcus sp. CAG:579]|jgi:ribosome recycling factor|uniref:ribosome recycling factor n=1 Tax=Ruminococcus sp. 210702-SL.1.03 TaxID=2883233 RepID=UPI0003361BE2|nr:ribosome recycling factor [Ruminococcus sp. 210702-SL.1.03]MCB6616497.1 ribosome recycling factor [Ruminococcus sp. 210702-SL.1.03]CDA71714.1 ribosome-recycling factor [Ruminococcus sp. CAG:579]